MRESGANRDVAIAFLHGLLGESGRSKFNINVPKKQSDALHESLPGKSQRKALDAMLKVKG
jgi:hypothetical protein